MEYLTQALVETAEMEDEEASLSKFDGEFTTEPPNNVLSKFDGSFGWKKEGEDKPQYYSFNENNVVLRGCRVRNTSWLNGLVVFAGNAEPRNSGTFTCRISYKNYITNYFTACFVTSAYIICEVK